MISYIWGIISNFISPDITTNENESSIRTIISTLPIAAFLFVVVFAPITEEITYRLCIFHNIKKKNRRKLFSEHGIEIKDIEYIEYKGKFFILSHFPLFNEEFAKMVNEDNEEVVVLYGHIHSNAPKGFVDGTYHVGMDTNNLTPISIEQIWQECSL